MVLDRLYTIDGISFSHRLSGKKFMISFSCKMELRWINSSPLSSRWTGMIYFGVFLFTYLIFLYTFTKKISAMRSSHLFWKLLCCKFWAWRPNNFNFLFVKLSSNSRQSLLQYLRENCFKNWRKCQCHMRGHH